MTEIEAYASSHELERYDPAATSLFRSDDPEEIVYKASKIATALADVIDKRGLVTNMRGRKHVNVEGWTLLGSMLGVFPVVEWSRALYSNEPGHGDDIIGWEARVSVRNMGGQEIGSAESMCTRSESTWKNRDDYAIRSMAQTRAVSKAMRHPLGFVMSMAGYDPTPEAEMAPTPQVQEPQAPRASEAAVGVLNATISQAAFFDPERWSLPNVLATASRVFSREIGGLNELTEPELRRIQEGAAEAVSKGQAEHAAAAEAAPEEEFFNAEETT